jgi:hypothetical protein
VIDDDPRPGHYALAGAATALTSDFNRQR